MRKVFVCELRRLLLNKFFFGILAAVLLYGWLLLSGEVILGVAYTAPFSPWSFGYYLARLLPLLWVGTLFFLTFFTSEGERRTAVLTGATAVDPRRFAGVRCMALLLGMLLLLGAAVLLAAVFFAYTLHWHDWGSLLLPLLAVAVPPLVFAAGSGWLLGGACPWLVYGWMPAPFILSALPLPEALGLWNGTLLRSYPLTLPADPPFTLPAAVWVAQGLLLLAGILLLGMRIFRRVRLA